MQNKYCIDILKSLYAKSKASNIPNKDVLRNSIECKPTASQEDKMLAEAYRLLQEQGYIENVIIVRHLNQYDVYKLDGVTLTNEGIYFIEAYNE